MRVKIRSDRDAYNWLFEQMSEEEAAAAIEQNIAEPMAADDSPNLLPKVVEFLNSKEGKDATVRQLLQQGNQDDNPNDEVVNVSEATISPATNARPTQSQIGVPNSLGFMFTTKGLGAFDAALAGNVNATGVIMAGTGKADGTYIVDGHHRWSSNIVANPNVNMTVTLIQADSGWKALAISQVVIAANIGAGKALPSNSSEPSTNLLTMDEAAIKKYLIDNVGKVVDAKAGPLLTDDVINHIAEKGYGGATATDSREVKLDKITTQIAKNAKLIPGADPQAPARALMPQFDPSVQGPDFNAVKPLLTGGQANFKDTAIKGGGKKKESAPAQGELPLKESLNENRIRRIHLPGIHRNRL